MAQRIEEIAAQGGLTAAQLALAWLLAQGPDIIPIPGSGRRSHLEENVRSAAVGLTAEQLSEIDAVAPMGVAAGERYPEHAMQAVNR